MFKVGDRELNCCRFGVEGWHGCMVVVDEDDGGHVVNAGECVC